MSEKTIIEINGVKMEIDLRQATVVENFKVGDKVKVLIKTYNDSFQSHVGTIVGFDAFKERPTIILAYLANDYGSAWCGGNKARAALESK